MLFGGGGGGLARGAAQGLLLLDVVCEVAEGLCRALASVRMAGGCLKEELGMGERDSRGSGQGYEDQC